MIKHHKETHPYHDDGTPYTFKDVMSNVDSGYHKLFTSSESSDLEKFGVGIVLYFKYIKYLIVFFLIYSIIAVPSIWFNMNGKLINFIIKSLIR